jgi:glycosyltransferase involved in cell wall biosynthesis
MRRRIVFISSNYTWGGSEVLWSEAAGILAARGEDVRAYKNRLNGRDRAVARLRENRVRLFELARFPFLPNKLYSLVAMFLPYLSIAYQALRLHLSLRLRSRPDLVVVSQGGNHDGWMLAAVCRRLKLPYVLLSQKATDLYWPQDRWLREVRANYRGALHAYFVSQHNLELTQEQLGEPLERASVVRNPFNVAYDARPVWPADDGEVRIACVGRLYPMEKGQDILLRVLARPEWRARPVSLTFYGAGEQREGLEGMARYLGLRNVRFAGYEDDVARIWASHHLLALPSRAEGLPLALVETMLCGRVAVVSDVAGNAELLREGVTGFIAGAAAEASFAEALERAWARRADWPAIGEAAARHAREAVPEDPAAAFVDALLALATPPR